MNDLIFVVAALTALFFSADAQTHTSSASKSSSTTVSTSASATASMTHQGFSSTQSLSLTTTTSASLSLSASTSASNASRTAPQSHTRSDSATLSQHTSATHTRAQSGTHNTRSVSMTLTSTPTQSASTTRATASHPSSRTLSGSVSLSHSIVHLHSPTANKSRSGSVSLSSTSTASTTESASLTLSTAWSPSTITTISSSTTASKTATSSCSLSASLTHTGARTRSPTVAATPSHATTDSETFSFNITKTVSRGTTGKRTFTMGTRTVSMSRSAMLDLTVQSRLSWVQRPMIFAAPGVPFTLQPIVAIDTPFNAQYAPQFCTLTSPEAGVILMGSLIARVTRGMCIFSGTGILTYTRAQNTSHSIPLVVTLNTTHTRFPRLQRSTNTTRVALAHCEALNAPAGSQNVFSLTPSRAVWGGNATVLDTTVSGYYFLYENRFRTQCHLNVSIPSTSPQRYALITTAAQYLDMCHVRCTFSAATVTSNTEEFLSTIGSSPTSGRVTIAVNGVELDSDCAGTDPLYLTGANNPCRDQTSPRRADGCDLHVVGAERVAVQFDPANKTIAAPFVSTTGAFTVPAVSLHLCDEANNTVFTKAPNLVTIMRPLSSLGCSALQVQPTGDTAPSSYGIECINVTAAVNHTDHGCGNPNEQQPLRFTVPASLSTSTATTTAQTLTYCVRNAKVNSSFVTGMEVLNADDVLSTTDDQTTLPVPLLVRFYNWLGDTVVRPLDPLLGTSDYPVQVDILQTNASSKGVPVVVQRTVVNVSLAQAPVVFDTISVTSPGVGYGVQLTGLSDGSPTLVLWGSEYPTIRNITTYSCGAFSSLFGLQFATYSLTNYTSCGGPHNTTVLQNRIPLTLTSVGPTVVSVFGWRFDYASSLNTKCQYSTLSDPWSATAVGSVATWVSSCEVRCTIPQQLNPISQTSASYATSPSTFRSKVSLPTNITTKMMAELGALRVKYGLLNSWSNALSLDVVGAAYRLDAGSSWASIQNTFYSKEVTRLEPPLQISVTDILGTPLLDLDLAARVVTVTTDNASSVDLNVSKVVRAVADTCDPDAGVASMVMVLESPTAGTYTLSPLSPGLQSGTINVFIVPFTNYSLFLLQARVTPYNFNTQTLENPLGTLPRQPVILAIDPTTLKLDTSVSDVSVIATVTPTDAATPITTGVNLDDTVCNPAFGNCAVLSNGVATFTKLSFVGVQGANYTLTIRIRNESRTSDAQALRYNITAAVCTNLPSNLSTMTASLVGPVNSSLRGPSAGFLIKGWKFDPAVGLTCLFNGTELPATIVDYCTARCLLHNSVANGGGGDVPTLNTSNCKVAADGVHVRCDNATGGPLYVCNGTCTSGTSSMTLVTGGDVTYVGRGRSIRMVPNVQSSRYLGNGIQAVVSAQQVRLDALLVAVVDSRGEFIADVDSSSDNLTVTLLPTITPEVNPFRVPYPYDGIFNDLDNSTCFPKSTADGGLWYPPMVINTNDSNLTCRVRQGLCVFDRVVLDYPRAGAFGLFAYSTSLTGNATFTLHIVSGPPNRLCIFTNLTGADSYIQHNYLLLHPPKLLSLDAAGNIFQPGTLDPVLSQLPYVTTTQGTAPSATIQVRLYGMVLGIDTNYTYLSQLPDSVALVSDYTATFSTLSISNATYGSAFVGEFYVVGGNPALAPVVSPPLQLLECTTGQFARWGGQSCETCLSGTTACDGQQDFCFMCNGSASLNVTDGYWRYSARSYQAYVCPLSSCTGNTELGTCTEGYLNHAPFCAVCDEGYAADFLGTCVRCSSIAATAALFTLACIAALIIIAIIVFVTVSEQEDDDNSLVLLLKICVNFIQTSGTIGEFAMDVPSTVKQFLGFQNSVSGGGGISIAPFNCLAPTFTFMTKYRIQMLGPPVAVIFVALACRAITNRLHTDFRNLFNLVIMVFLFLVYQTLVSQSVGAMYCQPILGENSELVMSVLKNDVRVSCLDGQYQYDFSLVLFALAIYGLGIPVVALIVVMRTSAKEGWEASYVRYSFLISGYRLRYWYWEIIIFARKIGLLLLVATTNNATLQALVGIWLLTASLVVTIRYQPFVKGVLNQAESLALAVQLITVNVGLFFRTVSTSATCGVLCVFVSCILLILNAAVFVYFGRHLLLEGYYRILGTFGLDVVHSDNRRYVSIRNIKKTIMLQLNTSRRADFGLYTPSAQSASIAVSSQRKRKNMVSFVGDEDGSEQVELLVLRRIVPDKGGSPKGDDTQPNPSRRRSRHGTRASGSGSSIPVPGDATRGGDDSPPLPLSGEDVSPNPSFHASLSFPGEQKESINATNDSVGHQR